MLHRGPLAGTPYDRWLSDLGTHVLLLAAQEQLDLSGDALPREGAYRHVEAVRGYDVNGYVEMRALQLARRHGVRHIVATQERDLERAAQLREILGL
ncbi:MAG TPA: NikS protein, partial [Candidatus Dormibacteraeota bacterium]|nr:NikS protein [Candidatus Dormibacteraeota bacterium]